MIIKSTAFLFILFFFFFKNINNYCEAAILKLSASVFSSCGVITARHDVILYKSEHIHFHNHLSNHTKFVCFVFKFGENTCILCLNKFLLFCSDPGNIELKYLAMVKYPDCSPDVLVVLSLTHLPQTFLQISLLPALAF